MTAVLHNAKGPMLLPLRQLLLLLQQHLSLLLLL